MAFIDLFLQIALTGLDQRLLTEDLRLLEQIGLRALISCGLLDAFQESTYHHQTGANSVRDKSLRLEKLVGSIRLRVGLSSRTRLDKELGSVQDRIGGVVFEAPLMKQGPGFIESSQCLFCSSSIDQRPSILT